MNCLWVRAQREKIGYVWGVFQLFRIHTCNTSLVDCTGLLAFVVADGNGVAGTFVVGRHCVLIAGCLFVADCVLLK